MSQAQNKIREYGYFAVAKFDPAKKVPFEPLLMAMSSLFRQIFSESDLNTEYHQHIASGVRPFWTSVCAMLDLPENLLWDTRLTRTPTNPQIHHSSSKSIQTDASSNMGQSTDLQRVINIRSVQFVSMFIETLRILASRRLICLCIDNIHHADDESLEMLANIVERKLGIAIIVSILLMRLARFLKAFKIMNVYR